MVSLRPLVLDPAGYPRVVADEDVLILGGPKGGIRHVGGSLSFFGGPAINRPGVLDGDFIRTIDQLIFTLAGAGLVMDWRPADWQMQTASLGQMAKVNPFVTGRLIVGSPGGWTALDLPAQQSGVLQVPARVGDVLAYAPVATWSKDEPLRPAPGCIWFDQSGGRTQLKVWDGGAWQQGLPAALAGLAAAGMPGAGDVLVGGAAGWQGLPAGQPGMVLTIDVSGQPSYEALVYVGTNPPWPDGDQAVRRDGALWADPSLNAEMLGFWDEGHKAWRRGYVNSPVLDQLAELRDDFLEGDSLFWGNNAMQRLAIGAEGDVLRSRSGVPVWAPLITVSPAPRAAPKSQELWLDQSTGTLRVNDNGRWVSANGTTWRDGNGSGAPLTPGRLVFLESGWKLATPAALKAGRLRGVVVLAGAAGSPVEATCSGLVSLPAADWSTAIDPADATKPGTGLNPGISYWLSNAGSGLLTADDASGVLVGMALNGNTLFLAGGGGPGAASGGEWFLSALDSSWPSGLQVEDLLAWSGTEFKKATTINGSKVELKLRADGTLVDETTGVVQPAGTPGAVAKAPTQTGLLGGTGYLARGEVQVGTAPEDPALFWLLDDGSTMKLSPQDMAKRYGLVATDLTTDQDAAILELVDTSGKSSKVILRGADGIEVTRTNAGTLVVSGSGLALRLNEGVDGGRFSGFSDPPPAKVQTDNYVIFKPNAGP